MVLGLEQIKSRISGISAPTKKKIVTAMKITGVVGAVLVCTISMSLIGRGHGKLYPYEPRSPLSGEIARPGSPWPKPFAHVTTPVQLALDPLRFRFDISSVTEKCDPLEFAVQKYNKDFLFYIPQGVSITPDPDLTTLVNVTVIIDSGENSTQCADYPKLNENTLYDSPEYYEINVETDGTASIKAGTVWGALRGIETFSQLIWSNDQYDEGPLYFYVNSTTIMDYPRFPHRGLMVDGARHYLPEDIYYEVLDGMMYNKLNVLHWHITDDQSFPYVSQKFPALSKMGAYSQLHIYTPEMVQRVIESARLRGIRVILEFDTPGHTQAFGASYPELLTPCYGTPGVPGTPKPPDHAARENIDPTKEFSYTFMKDFFSEVVANVSKDNYVHLGMDEVYTPCWESSPEIKLFMAQNNYTFIHQVQDHYTRRHVEMIKSLGVVPISWQDPLDMGVKLDKDVVIEIWKDWGLTWPEYLQGALNAGYKVILSAPWYINYINYGESWVSYYMSDPILNLTRITEEQKKQVLGGEACIWGEFVDKTNILSRIFPSVSAIAERLWSFGIGMTEDVWINARHRLDQHRCRMLQRGIPAQPILNGYCGPWELDD